MCLPCCIPFADVYLEDPPKKKEEEKKEEEQKEYIFVNDDAVFCPVSLPFPTFTPRPHPAHTPTTILRHDTSIISSPPATLASRPHIPKRLLLDVYPNNTLHHQNELLHLCPRQSRGTRLKTLLRLLQARSPNSSPGSGTRKTNQIGRAHV